MDAVATATGAKNQGYISEGALQFKDQVRSPADLRRLSDFERRIYLPLVLSAILPIVVAVSNAAEDSGVSIAVNIVAWLVFVLDLVVHARLIRRFLRSPTGIFDLVIVIITAPWFLLPGFSGSQILMLARLARLARLVFVSKSARRVLSRLGKVGLFALGMLLFCSWMAYVAEHKVNHEFATFGDALWWGIVTLTTVGYGDIVPETEKGRVAGTFLMLTGLATLGLISGTLASAFRLTPSGATESDVAISTNGDVAPATDLPPDVAAELDAVREQVAAIEERLTTILRGPEPP
jgi:voltage-gated potassium channel